MRHSQSSVVQCLIWHMDLSGVFRKTPWPRCSFEVGQTSSFLKYIVRFFFSFQILQIRNYFKNSKLILKTHHKIKFDD